MSKSFLQLLSIKQYSKNVKMYLGIAYGFSFLLWITAFFLAGNKPLLLSHEILNWSKNYWLLAASLVALLGGMGPFVAYLFTYKHTPNRKRLSFQGFLSVLKVFTPFAAISLFPMLVGLGSKVDFNANLAYLFVLFLFFTLVSGLEEFGWRGILYPNILENASTFHQANLATAIIWGFWHIPILIIMFSQQGVPFFQMLPLFLLFLASMYLMSYLHGWINIRSKSLLPNVLLHGLLSWWTFFLGFVLADTAIQMAVIVAYLATMLILEKYANSDVYLKNQSPKTDAFEQQV